MSEIDPIEYGKLLSKVDSLEDKISSEVANQPTPTPPEESV